MTRTIPLWITVTALGFAALLAACGGSTGTTTPTAGGTTPTAPPTATVALPSITAASAACPSASTVSSALGTPGLPGAVGVAPTGASSLPAGATGIVCDYHGSSDNVIIEVLTNINPSYISKFTAHFVGTVAKVSGVGDQATSFYQSLGSGKDNEGVVATKGQTLVSIGATYTPATLSQVEALVNSLL